VISGIVNLTAKAFSDHPCFYLCCDCFELFACFDDDVQIIDLFSEFECLAFVRFPEFLDNVAGRAELDEVSLHGSSEACAGFEYLH